MTTAQAPIPAAVARLYAPGEILRHQWLPNGSLELELADCFLEIVPDPSYMQRYLAARYEEMLARGKATKGVA